MTISDGCDGILDIDVDSENIVTIDTTVTGEEKSWLNGGEIWCMCRWEYKVWNDSRADSVEYLELCDKHSSGWLRKQAPGRAQNPLAGLVTFDANGSRSETMASKVLLRYF